MDRKILAFGQHIFSWLTALRLRVYLFFRLARLLRAWRIAGEKLVDLQKNTFVNVALTTIT
ncbi:hypothetical protein A3A66_00280 [Microgenomates group bacterium RIFCSPLOWO2_01_FULL_46_13]|nr:MAG: hypothetical protein A3A66_00280 [Microgenomates group bacterium RIFCSPLOWO2_01_FULL_46_13]